LGWIRPGFLLGGATLVVQEAAARRALTPGRRKGVARKGFGSLFLGWNQRLPTPFSFERFPIHTYSPGQVTKLLERAGFEVVDLIGKTVLPMRHHREMLADSQARRTWMKMEKRLWRDPAAIGRAAHLQIVGRAKPTGA
jgi:hypothetical protein